MKIKTLLVDAETLFVEGLSALLQDEGKALEPLKFQVLGIEKNGDNALKKAKALEPSLVLIDPFSLEGLSGIDLIKRLRLALPDTKILILTAMTSDFFVRQSLKLGVSGVVLKRQELSGLILAISQVRAGNIYLDPKLATRVFVNDISGQLSDREYEVLRLIAEGESTKDISDVIDTSIKTVETHRRNIMHKLKIHSVAGLTKYAIREGIVRL